MSAAVDVYLAALPDDQRACLVALRALIRSRLPDHVECISYAMPGFRQPGPNGRMVAGYAGFARNCGYYPHSGHVIGQFAGEVTGFKTSKGGILFTPQKPLPDALVLKFVEARLVEIANTAR